MRNFIIIFAEKEGTSPLIRLLNNFDQISIVHQVNTEDWEPFDIHNRGAMTLGNLERCLDMVFNKESIDFNHLNQLYTRTAKKPLEEFGRNEVTGLKMRFTTPSENSRYWNTLPKNFTYDSFRLMMFDVLKRNDVVVFLALRQDILRWALSKYHGDGTGNPGHLQFKLAKGRIKRSSIGKIHVDSTRFKTVISQCVEAHARKRRLMEDFKLAAIQTHFLVYEDFLTDKQKVLNRILDILELNTSNQEIDAAIKKGAYFEKVHSDDIASFVVNHEEILEQFGKYRAYTLKRPQA
jgi:hypothetical protein